MKGRLVLLFAVLAVFLLVPTSVGAQEKRAEFERYDVSIRVLENGDIRVTEVQTINFYGGPFTWVSRGIRPDFLENIKDIAVTEAGQPLQFEPYYEGNELKIKWIYPETYDTTRSFELSYTVTGALRIYPEGDVLGWAAVPDGHPVLVKNSRVDVFLPREFTDEEVAFQAVGVPAEVVLPEPGHLVFTSVGEIPLGQFLEVWVRFPHGFVQVRPPAWQLEMDQHAAKYEWSRFDVRLKINPDGSVNVEETQVIKVLEGHLYRFFRQLGLQETDGIRDVSAEGYAFVEPAALADGTFSIQQKGDLAEIAWQFPQLHPGEEVILTLGYTALNPMRVYEDTGVDQLRWVALPGNRTAPIREAEIAIYVPEGAKIQAEDSYLLEILHEGKLLDDHIVFWTGAVDPGQEIVAQVNIARESLGVPESGWQQAMEEQLRRQEEMRRLAAEREAQEKARRARIQLGLLVATLAFLMFSPVISFIVWDLWGRDEPVSLGIGYLTKPPNTLHPAVVATIVEEGAGVRAVLATIFRLAKKGAIGVIFGEDDVELVELTPEGARRGVGRRLLNLARPADLSLRPYEGWLLDSLFRDRDRVWLSDLPNSLREELQRIFEAVGEEAAKFFEGDPVLARTRWRHRGQWLMIIGGTATAGVSFIFSLSYGPVTFGPALGLIWAGFWLWIFSRWMPRRSEEGAKANALWAAFGCYLANLQEYAGLEAAQRILDEHFDYAVALGVVAPVVSFAAKQGAFWPSWAEPLEELFPEGEAPQRGYRRSGGVRVEPTEEDLARREGRGRIRLPSNVPEIRPAFSLQKTSDALVRGLQQASDRLFDLLNTAVEPEVPSGPSFLGRLADALAEGASGGGAGSEPAFDWSSPSSSPSSGWSRGPSSFGGGFGGGAAGGGSGGIG